MSTFEAYCDESISWFGQAFEEVHRWLDAFQGTPKYRMRHRRVRHHEAGIREATALFGEIAKESLDSAVYRRFDFKVVFDYLKPEQAWLLFKAMAAGLKVPIQPSEDGQLKARLAHLHHLTPGDFAVVKRKSLMYEKKLTGDLLLNWLEQEVSSKPGLKKGLVGF